jgi:integrase
MARMTRPSFSVYRLASGRWQVHATWYEAGVRRQRKLGTHITKKAALAAGDAWQADVLRGDMATPSTFTLDGWLDAWLRLCELAGLRPRTIADYADKLRLHVRPQIGDIALTEVEPSHLDGVYAAMAEKDLSARTIRYVHSVVHKALADAVRKDLLVVNPADRATPPRARAARAAERVVWTPDELRRFLAALDDHPFGAVLHVLAMTGLRRSEVLAVSWDAVDLEGGTLVVRAGLTQVGTELHFAEPKTSRGRRVVDLDARTIAVLRAHRRRQLEDKVLVGPGYRDHGLVFARPDGDPWMPASVTQAFGKLVARLELRPIALHDLRHGHATYLLALGTDHNTVADRLGHASAGFTLSTYGHSLPGKQRDAAAAVAALVADSG